MRERGTVGLVLLLCGCAPVPLLAQDNPVLRAALVLAQEGRADSARRLVESEVARARPGEAAWVEALFVRARILGSGDSAERDLRRVAIEYSSSRWADDALLLLSQLAMAAGNPQSARDLAVRLRSDYPDSEHRPGAAYWAARAGFQLGQTAEACALLDSAGAESAGDVELANQILYYRSRCAAAGPPAANPALAPPPAAPPARDTQPARAAGGAWEVQVAAARTDADAQRVADQMTEAGHSARVITGADGYRRVRIGPYRTEREAMEAARVARRVVGGSPFIVRAQ